MTEAKKLRELYARQEETLLEIDRMMSTLIEKHGANPIHLSNPILGRFPYQNQLFKRLLNRQYHKSCSPLRFTFHLIHYVLNNGLEFMRYLFIFILYRFHKSPPSSKKWEAKKIHLIDTFLFTNSVLKNNTYEDQHFNDLADFLKANGHEVIVCPSFIGWNTWRSFGQLFKLMDAHRHTFCHEFELLKFSDLFSALIYIIRYPWYTWSLSKKIKGQQAENVCADEIKHSIRHITFHGYLKYLLGRRIMEKAQGHVKAIIWNENQARDRNLIKGLRSKPENLTIYGFKCYIINPTQRFLFPVAGEERHGLVADKVLINGPAFMKWVKAPFENKFFIGPSFRYGKVFQDHPPTTRTDILITLPLHPENVISVLQVCLESDLSQKNCLVKFHPAFKVDSVSDWIKKFPKTWTITEDDIYTLFDTCGIVVSTESSSAIEAACCHKTVVIIADQNTFTSNPMPPEGQGQVWDLLFDARDMTDMIQKLNTFRLEQSGVFKSIVDQYKQDYFTHPTEELIRRSFDLDR